MTCRAFESKREEELLVAYSAGVTIAECARRFGTGKDSVRAALARNGVATRTSTLENMPRLTDVEGLILGYQRGNSIRVLSRTFNVGYTAVRKTLLRHKISLRSEYTVRHLHHGNLERKADPLAYKREQNKRMSAVWRKANPEQARQNAKRQRARLTGAKGGHTLEDVRQKYLFQGGLCRYCRQDVPWDKKHIDHMIPLCRGGWDCPVAPH